MSLNQDLQSTTSVDAVHFVPESDHTGMYKVKFVMTDPRAIAPVRGSADAAGLDLAPFVDGIVQAEQNMLINTGLAVEMPIGHYGRIAARSSVLMRGITISGDIDYDYRGDIKLIVVNNTKFPFILKAGEAIAHLIISPYIAPEVEFTTRLQLTGRGLKGFGSSTSGNQYVINNDNGLIYKRIVTANENLAIEDNAQNKGD